MALGHPGTTPDFGLNLLFHSGALALAAASQLSVLLLGSSYKHQEVTSSCTVLSPSLIFLQGRKQDCKNITETNMREVKPTLLIQPEDIVPKEPGSSEETVRVLLRPSDKVSNHYKTTSSEINGIVGAVPPMCKHVKFLMK